MLPPAQCMSCRTPSRSLGTSTPRYSSIRVFQASGRSRSSTRPSISSCSSEAEDDVHVVGDLVRVDADQGRLHLVDGAVERLLVDRRELGEVLLQPWVEVAPEGAAAADQVLPGAALRLVDAERDAAPERLPRQLRGHPPLVDAVAELVHRREDGGQVVRAEVGREADVAVAGRRHERMCSRVEPPLVVGEAEAANELEAERALYVRVEVALEKRVVDAPRVADLLDQRAELLLEAIEDLAHLGGLHPGLVVVQEDVVSLIGGIEAVDVAVLELQVLLQMGQHRLVVRVLLRGAPVGHRERARPAHLARQRRRNANRLLVVAPRDADQARVVTVVVEAPLELLQVLEEGTELGSDEALVGQPPDRRERVRTCLRAAGRHHHALVPEEQRGRLPQVVDLAEEAFQLIELGICHGANFVRRRRFTRRGSVISLPPVRPLGRRIRTSAISAPTTTILVPPGRSTARPKRWTPFSASARNESTPLTARAPTTAPHRLVAPPITSIASVMNVRSR